MKQWVIALLVVVVTLSLQDFAEGQGHENKVETSTQGIGKENSGNTCMGGNRMQESSSTKSQYTGQYSRNKRHPRSPKDSQRLLLRRKQQSELIDRGLVTTENTIRARVRSSNMPNTPLEKQLASEVKVLMTPKYREVNLKGAVENPIEKMPTRGNVLMDRVGQIPRDGSLIEPRGSEQTDTQGLSEKATTKMGIREERKEARRMRSKKYRLRQAWEARMEEEKEGEGQEPGKSLGQVQALRSNPGQGPGLGQGGNTAQGLKTGLSGRTDFEGGGFKSVQDNCTSEYIYIAGVGSYKISCMTLTWREAKRFCSTEGGNLVVFNNLNERASLQRVIEQSNQRPNNGIFVGSTFNAVSNVKSTVTGESSTIEECLTRAAIANHAVEICAIIRPSTNCLDYLNCNLKLKFVCERKYT